MEQHLKDRIVECIDGLCKAHGYTGRVRFISSIRVGANHRMDGQTHVFTFSTSSVDNWYENGAHEMYRSTRNYAYPMDTMGFPNVGWLAVKRVVLHEFAHAVQQANGGWNRVQTSRGSRRTDVHGERFVAILCDLMRLF